MNNFFPRSFVVLSLLTLVSCSPSASNRTDSRTSGNNATTVDQIVETDDQQQQPEPQETDPQTPTPPPRQEKFVTKFDGLTIEWVVGEPVILESVTHMLGGAPGALKLSAKEGARLIGVPFAWSVPDATPEETKLVIGNLMFQAVDAEGRTIRANAFALGDCSEPVMWLVPAEGSGFTYPLDHLASLAVDNFSPAFLLPNDWKSIEIRFGPIDGEPVIIGSVTLPPVESASEE